MVIPPLSTLIGVAIAIAATILIGRPIVGSIWGRLRGRVRKKDPEEDLPWKNEPKIPSLLLVSNESYSEMKKVSAVSGEFLLDPFDKQRRASKKDVIYTGLPARTIMFTADIFPTRIARLFYSFLFPFGFRVRFYHQLYDEPCTRDLYSGDLLRPEKKRQTLIEKGVIDKEGYFLEDGQRLILDERWVKVDFSDVDFIKSEYHAYKQSEAVVKTAQAMAKTGSTVDRWFFYVMLGALVTIVLIVLMLSGVMK